MPPPAGSDQKTDGRQASADENRPHPYMHLKNAAAEPAQGDEGLAGELAALLAEQGTLSPTEQATIVREFSASPAAMQPGLFKSLQAQLAFHRDQPPAGDPYRDVTAAPRKQGRSAGESRFAASEPPAVRRPRRERKAPARLSGDRSDNPLPLANAPAEIANEEHDENGSVAYASDQDAALDAANEEPMRRDVRSDVRLAAYEEYADDSVPAPVDWQVHLDNTIRSLARETRDAPRTSEEAELHARLRLLQLAAGQREAALAPIAGIGVSEQDFWSSELFGLSTWLDTQKFPKTEDRAAAAGKHLSKAVARLKESSGLVVRNLAFCTEVASYGIYTPFKSTEFASGAETLLYAEVENFKSEETEKGFQTSLRGSYQILNAQGQRVAANDFAPTEDNCRNPRRDFFIVFMLNLPDKLNPGEYTLKLTVVDRLSDRIAEDTIEFSVKQGK